MRQNCNKLLFSLVGIFSGNEELLTNRCNVFIYLLTAWNILTDGKMFKLLRALINHVVSLKCQHRCEAEIVDNVLRDVH